MVTFLVPGRFLRNHVQHVGSERSANKGPGYDLHPVSLLQVHGGRRPLPPPDLRHSAPGPALPEHGPGPVRSSALAGDQAPEDPEGKGQIPGF